jgi:hypothetical protein
VGNPQNLYLYAAYNMSAADFFSVTLPLTAGTDGNAWLPGKKYVYTIVFGDNEIRIAPTVTEWKDEPNVNIEVQ